MGARQKNSGSQRSGFLYVSLSPSSNSDEKAKLRLGQWGSPMVSGSDLGESSVPQNLGAIKGEDAPPP
jgi:hypothetical protein